MSGLLGSIFCANFYNSSSEYVCSKRIKWSLTRPKLKTFSYDKKEYIVSPSSYMFKVSPFPYLFDYYVSSYELNNPSSIKQTHDTKPLIPAKSLHSIMQQNELVKLLSGRKKLSEYFTLRNILILLAVVGVVVYFMMGGSVEGALDTVETVGSSPAGRG